MVPAVNVAVRAPAVVAAPWSQPTFTLYPSGARYPPAEWHSCNNLVPNQDVQTDLVGSDCWGGCGDGSCRKYSSSILQVVKSDPLSHLFLLLPFLPVPIRHWSTQSPECTRFSSPGEIMSSVAVKDAATALRSPVSLPPSMRESVPGATNTKLHSHGK